MKLAVVWCFVQSSLSFAFLSQLDEKETSARGDAFADIKDSIHGTFPNFGVGQFGSHPAGLSIFSSDIDLTVVRPVLFSGLETQWGGEVNCSLEETEEAAGCKRPSSPLIEREAKRIKTNPSDCDQIVTWALDTAAAPLNTMDEDCVVLLETNANDSNSEGAVTAELDAASMGSIEEGEVSDDDDDDESRGSDNSVGAHDLHEDARADKLNCLQDIYDLLRVGFPVSVFCIAYYLLIVNCLLHVWFHSCAAFLAY